MSLPPLQTDLRLAESPDRILLIIFLVVGVSSLQEACHRRVASSGFR